MLTGLCQCLSYGALAGWCRGRWGWEVEGRERGEGAGRREKGRRERRGWHEGKLEDRNKGRGDSLPFRPVCMQSKTSSPPPRRTSLTISPVRSPYSSSFIARFCASSRAASLPPACAALPRRPEGAAVLPSEPCRATASLACSALASFCAACNEAFRLLDSASRRLLSARRACASEVLWVTRAVCSAVEAVCAASCVRRASMRVSAAVAPGQIRGQNHYRGGL